jgi:ribosomal protein S18 acetylase RimI-like enzyme
VRPARAAELAEVGALCEAVYLGEGLAGAGYGPALRDAAGRARSAHVLVAVDPASAVLLGSVTFCLAGSPLSRLAGPDEAEFRMLVVASAVRGRGVGHALVLACADAARAAGCTRLRLTTNQAMVAAVGLYVRLGFRRTPERDWTDGAGELLPTYALDL